MRMITKPVFLTVPFVIGAVIGYIGGPAFVLIPWGLAGLVIGALCATRRLALFGGAVYGFALAYVFMIAGYSGTAPITSKLLPFVMFGVVGAVCGSALSLFGYFIRSGSRKR